MPNVSSHISSHNITTLNKCNPAPETPDMMCNCHNKQSCPLDGKCLTRSIIYNGKLTIGEGNVKNYIGLCEPDFKGRYSDHKTSFTHRKYSTKTKLATEFWKAVDEGHNIGINNIEFSILKECSPYRAGSRKCNLCLCEKLFILKNEATVINKRDELISKCRHSNKFMLKNFKRKRK